MRGALAVAVAVVAVGCMLRSSTARACSPECLSQVLPNETSKDVPTNTRVWLMDDLGTVVARRQFSRACETKAEPSLETSAGKTVPTEIARLGIAAVLTPAEPLRIGESYTIRINCDNLNAYDVVFTVTAQADTTPPEPPDVSLGKLVDEEDDCWKLKYRSVNATGGDPLYFVDAHADAKVEGVTVQGPLEGITASLGQLGAAGCDQGHWPGSDLSLPFRFASVDLAGNRSAWTDPITVGLVPDVPAPAAGCMPACSTSPAGRNWTGLGLLVFLLGLRRRPNKRSVLPHRQTQRGLLPNRRPALPELDVQLEEHARDE